MIAHRGPDRLQSDPSVRIRSLFAGGSVAGVYRALFHQNHDLTLGLSEWLVIDSFRNNQHLPFIQRRCPVSEIHPKLPRHDQKRLISFGMAVPDKVSFEPGETKLKAVHLGNGSWSPLLGKLSKFLQETDRCGRHAYSLSGLSLSAGFSPITNSCLTVRMRSRSLEMAGVAKTASGILFSAASSNSEPVFTTKMVPSSALK